MYYMASAYKRIARFYSSISKQQLNFLRAFILKLSGPRKSKIGFVRRCVPGVFWLSVVFDQSYVGQFINVVDKKKCAMTLARGTPIRHDTYIRTT